MSIWSNLTFHTGSAFTSLMGKSTNWRIRKDTSALVYKNPRYKSVAVHAARQYLMSELEGNLNKIIPQFKKQFSDAVHEHVLAQQTRKYETLIENQANQAKNWGQVDAGGGHTIIAKDKYGSAVKEALMLYYKDEATHTVKDVVYQTGTSKETTYSTDVVCHIDLAPQVSVSSSKNIVMTQVQGRDYTRKELVSGGDLQFSISGNIVSDEMGVYPTDAVKKFVQIMEYNGILNVNFMMFEPFNVTRIIVKDYSLSQQTYKNIQPYSFNCVAVEPDDEVKINTDTISVINKELTLSPMNKWYKLILENKLASMVASSVADSVATGVTTGVSLGLDEITTNI